MCPQKKISVQRTKKTAWTQNLKKKPWNALSRKYILRKLYEYWYPQKHFSHIGV